MKSAIIALAIFGCAVATSVDQTATVLRSVNEQQPDGSFKYGFENDNNIAAQADGKVKVFNKDEVALEVQGSFQFKTPEGQVIQQTYIANENGFQAQGDHLPTPPAPQAIPDYIQRSLEYIAAHPYIEKKL